MRLNDLLPTTYMYKDTELEMDLSFDNVLDIFDVLKSHELLPWNIAEMCLVLLFGDELIEREDIIDVWNDVFDKYIDQAEKEVIRYDIAGNPMPKKEKSLEPTISIEQDAEFIYASFIQTYGINLLQEQSKLHWWEFRALMNGLPENTIIKQIIHIRSWKPGKHDTEEYKEQMRELQDYYRLEVDEWPQMETLE